MLRGHLIYLNDLRRRNLLKYKADRYVPNLQRISLSIRASYMLLEAEFHRSLSHLRTNIF